MTLAPTDRKIEVAVWVSSLYFDVVLRRSNLDTPHARGEGVA